jgi:hypothetical protein
MSIIRHNDCYQGHPVPKNYRRPSGPFPPEIFKAPEVVTAHESPYDDTGGNFKLGATSQNNFEGYRWLRCYDCHTRVREDETEDHECEE